MILTNKVESTTSFIPSYQFIEQNPPGRLFTGPRPQTRELKTYGYRGRCSRKILVTHNHSPMFRNSSWSDQEQNQFNRLTDYCHLRKRSYPMGFEVSPSWWSVPSTTVLVISVDSRWRWREGWRRGEKTETVLWYHVVTVRRTLLLSCLILGVPQQELNQEEGLKVLSRYLWRGTPSSLVV